MSDACPGCRAAKAQPYAWFLLDAARPKGRVSKPARKIRSRVERHSRLFRRGIKPVKWQDIDWG